MPDFELIAHLCIWPESEKFKAALAEDNGKTFIFPRVKHADPLRDGVIDAKLRLKNELMERQQTTMDYAGLQALIGMGNMRAALNLTVPLLTDFGQGSEDAQTSQQACRNTSLSFQIWTIRFQLLLALKMYNALLEELQPFQDLDSPDTFLQYYAEYNLKGSIIPFNLRMIHAEALVYSSEPWSAFNRIRRLEENTKLALSMAQDASLAEYQVIDWHKRLEAVHLLEANVLYRLKRFDNSFSMYENIANITTDVVRKRNILKNLIRMSISTGSLSRFERYAKLYSSQTDIGETDAEFCDFLRALFFGNYSAAKERISTHKLQHTEQYLKDCNNEAICHLYDGKIDESVRLLFEHSGKMIEPIFTNLSTILDLSSTSGKEILQDYFLKHCDVTCDFFDPNLK